jgi:microcystin-dependent protein
MKLKPFTLIFALCAFLLLSIGQGRATEFTDDTFAPTHDVQTDMQAIENNFAILRANFAQSTEPTNTIAGQWWYDTTAHILKLRNEANTAWQYVWDIANNQPMGTVTTSGTVTYAGTQLLSAVTLSMGTTNTKVASTGFSYTIAAAGPYIKGPVPAGTSLAAGTIPTNKWGIYLFSVDGSGTITSTAGDHNFDTGYVDEATAIAAIPDTPAGQRRMGYITVLTYSGQPFIGGTDALQGGTGGYPAATTNYYPDTAANTYTGNVTPTPSAYSGIYYVKATNRNYVTTPTINLNSLGAKTIVKHNGAALVANDIVDGHDMVLRYDGTYMVLTNPSGEPPVGSVITTFEDACPTGYIEVNGAAISRTTYSRLFSKYWTKYGAGDGTTTFNLPDMRGRFARGWDHGAARDPDRASRTDRGDGTTGDYVGTKQGHEFYSHTHSGGYVFASTYPRAYEPAADPNQNGYNYASIAAAGGNETRPVNINVLYCVKY